MSHDHEDDPHRKANDEPHEPEREENTISVVPCQPLKFIRVIFGVLELDGTVHLHLGQLADRKDSVDDQAHDGHCDYCGVAVAPKRDPRNQAKEGKRQPSEHTKPQARPTTVDQLDKHPKHRRVHEHPELLNREIAFSNLGQQEAARTGSEEEE